MSSGIFFGPPCTFVHFRLEKLKEAIVEKEDASFVIAVDDMSVEDKECRLLANVHPGMFQTSCHHGKVATFKSQQVRSFNISMMYM